MPQRRRAARAALTAAAATACLALAAPAWAGASLAQLAPGNGNNPKGDNGTVKIDGQPFTDSVDNMPHVTCHFELEFFNFDENQRAHLSLASQAPSKPEKVVWSERNRIISTDPARGAADDHDVVIRLSAWDLDLAGVKVHKQHGYHLKLDVDLVDGHSADGKAKVFWLKPCDSTASPSPTPSPEVTEPSDPDSTEPPATTDPTGPPATTDPTDPTDPAESPSATDPAGSPEAGDPAESPEAGDGGAGGGNETGGRLPLTGAAVTSIALTGAALIGGGAALVLLRRRRDRITFTS